MSNNKWVYWLVAWNLSALLLFVRRVAIGGADIAGWQIVLVSLALALVVSAARFMMTCDCCGIQADPANAKIWLPWAFTPGFIIMTLWLLSLSGPIWITNFFVVFVFAGCEAGWILALRNLKRQPEDAALVQLTTAPTESQDSDEGSSLPDDVDQQFTRRKVDGADEVSGLLRVRYEQGQRVASAFAGFVPPLLPNPVCEAEAVGGSEATVKIADIHAQGVEFELRRDAVDDGEDSTVIEFYARVSD